MRVTFIIIINFTTIIIIIITATIIIIIKKNSVIRANCQKKVNVLFLLMSSLNDTTPHTVMVNDEGTEQCALQCSSSNEMTMKISLSGQIWLKLTKKSDLAGSDFSEKSNHARDTDALFLDAIASPSTYPCQWWVRQ